MHRLPGKLANRISAWMEHNVNGKEFTVCSDDDGPELDVLQSIKSKFDGTLKEDFKYFVSD